MARLALLAVTLSGAAAVGADVGGLTIKSDRYEAQLSEGSLTSLRDAQGRVLVRPVNPSRGMGIHRIDSEHWVTASPDPTKSVTNQHPVTQRFETFSNLPGATAEATSEIDRSTGDFVATQRATAASAGVWGVSWSIAEVPLEYAVLVPGRSGVRLTAATPGTRHEFDYPQTWEAQLVILEGPGHGFAVWAEDVKGRYKRLVVERSVTGWRLTFYTINNAPFDLLTGCESVAWHLNVYEGDWRVPAKHYRDWAQANFHPTPIEHQQPGWVPEIRACVIMGLDRAVLDALPARLDPRQTLLYLPDWRTAGYDRNYPEYDQPVPELDPFVRRAHELGFRVMLHVNYFGVDPLNPLYAKFEPYQVRSPWGSHEKQWWLWERATPVIRFAYINPARKEWRDTFTECMVGLCTRTGVDALHLDQTLCIDNDHNGLIDGMTMIEGNVALHRQLREALPEVALSGEGLNEVTYRYESFAQRHAWGLNHDDGTWDRRWLDAAHPISSYLMRPDTIIYGYLGYVSPEHEQLYAAWNEAYEHWGVIPTLVPSLGSLRQPLGFARQFFDEVTCWQHERLSLDLDGPWPADVAFPLRTSAGRPAAKMADSRFVCDGREIGRTVHGVAQLEAPGSIPGWRAYDESRLFGLDPDLWYPYFSEPRDAEQFHVTEMPADLIAQAVEDRGDLALIRTRDAATVVADLGAALDRATCGVRPFQGEAHEAVGPLDGPDGAQFQVMGDILAAHPPYKNGGTGVAFARYEVDLPPVGAVWFLSEVALDVGAVGPERSDGVTFGVTVQAGNDRLHAELDNATAEHRPLVLDLSRLAGRRATVELTVDPGPKRSPSFDWARWFQPRIERQASAEGTIALAGKTAWSLALDRSGPRPIQREGTVQRVTVHLPGAVFLLAQKPPTVALPLDLAKQPLRVGFYREDGQVLESAQFAGVHPERGTVGGIARDGLFAHPPDHGRTVVSFPVTLPGPAVFRSEIGIRDGSTSDGVVFAIEVNGQELARRRMRPGKWETLSVDLPGSAPDLPIVLTLVTDSDGGFDCDWAQWGDPRIEPRP